MFTAYNRYIQKKQQREALKESNMKKSRKAVIAAAAFYAAVNFNGCVYGPPPEEIDDSTLAQDSFLTSELIEENQENPAAAEKE